MRRRRRRREKREGGVMNRCGQPYLAVLLLCGIRCTLGSLVDDAGHLDKLIILDELWLYGGTHA